MTFFSREQVFLSVQLFPLWRILCSLCVCLCVCFSPHLIPLKPFASLLWKWNHSTHIFWILGEWLVRLIQFHWIKIIPNYLEFQSVFIWRAHLTGGVDSQCLEHNTPNNTLSTSWVLDISPWTQLEAGSLWALSLQSRGFALARILYNALIKARSC